MGVVRTRTPMPQMGPGSKTGRDPIAGSVRPCAPSRGECRAIMHRAVLNHVRLWMRRPFPSGGGAAPVPTAATVADLPFFQDPNGRAGR